MTTTTKNSTREVLAQMLTENTGAHFLDSGGAYGRHWERNKGKTQADFDTEPQATADRWGGVVLSVYHYLARRLEYSPDVQSEFEEFTKATDPNDYWLTVAEEFAKSRDGEANTWNSYNGDCYLSQTIQGVTFYDKTRNENFVLLQIHGGCDVRGGYTAPRAFRIVVDSAELFPYDHASYSVECSGSHEHSLYCSFGEMTNSEGATAQPEQLPKSNDEGKAVCGTCGSDLAFYAPEPY